MAWRPWPRGRRLGAVALGPWPRATWCWAMAQGPGPKGHGPGTIAPWPGGHGLAWGHDTNRGVLTGGLEAPETFLASVREASTVTPARTWVQSPATYGRDWPWPRPWPRPAAMAMATLGGRFLRVEKPPPPWAPPHWAPPASSSPLWAPPHWVPLLWAPLLWASLRWAPLLEAPPPRSSELRGSYWEF